MKKLLSVDSATLLFAALFVVTAVLGGINNFSAVPFWDMWDGHLDFYRRVREGEVSAWWSQHNEHRIVISRLLFFIDLRFFRGSSYFLIILNYVFLGSICYLLLMFFRSRVGGATRSIGFFLVAWIFFWAQYQNITWAFQSQFFLAQLIPMAAFYSMHKYYDDGRIHPAQFVFAIVLGVLSVGTMANGVLVMPLLAVMALVLGGSLIHRIIPILFSSVLLVVYFRDFKAVGNHGSLDKTLVEFPIEVVRFFLAYVGSPFYYIFGESSVSLSVATHAGILFTVVLAVYFFSLVRASRFNSLEISLLSLIAYICISALATAGGRVNFGIEQAVASRYVTPSLIAWGALVILVAPVCIARWNRFFISSIILLLVVMTPYQLRAAQYNPATTFDREVAGLAIALKVRDEEQIALVAPNVDRALQVAQAVSTSGTSFVGAVAMRDLVQAIGRPSVGNGFAVSTRCEGYVDGVGPPIADGRFVKIRGWLVPGGRWRSPLLKIYNKNGILIGYAKSGNARPDVSVAVPQAGNSAGFVGYVLRDYASGIVSVLSPDAGCSISGKLNLPIFRVSDINDRSFSSMREANVEVVAFDTFSGADFYKSSFPGLSVFGSFVKSDQDMGRVLLRLGRNSRLLYRSGPTGGRQVLKILLPYEASFPLPVAVDWKVLSFEDQGLPDEFTIEISDTGDGWGEWSAIAVASDSSGFDRR